MIHQNTLKQSLILTTLLLSALGKAADVSSLMATHNSLHQMEHLVSGGELDQGFVTNLRAMRVEALAHEGATDPAFKVTIEQYPAADGSRKAVEIVINADGKPGAFTVQEGGEAVGAPQWQGKNAAARIEQAQHGLLHAGATDPQLAPFANATTGIVIAPQTDASGSVLAQVDVSSSSSTAIYRALVNDKGKVVSAGIVTR